MKYKHANDSEKKKTMTQVPKFKFSGPRHSHTDSNSRIQNYETVIMQSHVGANMPRVCGRGERNRVLKRIVMNWLGDLHVINWPGDLQVAHLNFLLTVHERLV